MCASPRPPASCPFLSRSLASVSRRPGVSLAVLATRLAAGGPWRTQTPHHMSAPRSRKRTKAGELACEAPVPARFGHLVPCLSPRPPRAPSRVQHRVPGGLGRPQRCSAARRQCAWGEARLRAPREPAQPGAARRQARSHRQGRTGSPKALNQLAAGTPPPRSPMRRTQLPPPRCRRRVHQRHRLRGAGGHFPHGVQGGPRPVAPLSTWLALGAMSPTPHAAAGGLTSCDPPLIGSPWSPAVPHSRPNCSACPLGCNPRAAQQPGVRGAGGRPHHLQAPLPQVWPAPLALPRAQEAGGCCWGVPLGWDGMGWDGLRWAQGLLAGHV